MARTTLRAHARNPSARSDADLVTLTRNGDEAAFGELWRRHAHAGLTVARSFTSSFDADDLVSEAFAKILNAIKAGGGPTSAFRAYLFTTIRNTASGWGRSRNEVPIEDADAIEDPAFSESNTLAALDRSLTAQAFRSMPTRWQEVLWYSEVEQMTPLEIAPLLGMKANAVAALAYRAREGLRQAWIQAHIASTPAESDCRWTVERLGSYARHGLGRRDTSKVESHLEECAKCTIVASEAREVESRLALVLLPLTAGIAGAGAYTVWMQSGTHTALAAMGASGVGAVGAGLSSAGSSTGAARAANVTRGAGVGVVAGSIAAGVLVVAGAASAVVFGPALVRTMFPPAPTISAAGPATTAPSALPSTTPSAPVDGVNPDSPTPPTTLAPAPTVPPVSTPTTPAIPPSSTPATPPTTPPVTPPTTPPVVPPVTTAPDAPLVTAPASTGTLTNANSIAVSGTGTPGATVAVNPGPTPALASVASSPIPSAATLGAPLGTVTVPSSGSWSLTADISGLAEGVHILQITQSNKAGSSPAVSRSITIDRHADAPVISTVDTGSGANQGLWFPILSGTAEPSAQVRITDGASTNVLVTADASGTWTTQQLATFAGGTSTVTAVQTDPAGNVSPASAPLSVDVSPPPNATVTGTGTGFDLSLAGIPYSAIQAMADGGTGWGPTSLPSSGTVVQTYIWTTTPGDHIVEVRYGSGTRWGPSITAHVTIN